MEVADSISSRYDKEYAFQECSGCGDLKECGRNREGHN